ncbi:hypothetical protein PPYR_14877 [Photinus pyralis]|uniref:Ionotropic glutamate receptor C-terminal domain-containing protein n=1 Tax=Photinus pyralis TaxID=7054 RepID=A0A5N4A036_PHOPY|nr:hypothetical protein PPYR_14877 [Photinus pyralis]
MKVRNVLYFVLLARVSRSTGNVQMASNETSLLTCTEKAIEKLFGEETLYYIFNNNTSYLLPFYTKNPKVIINAKGRLRILNKKSSHNVVILVDHFEAFKGDIYELHQSSRFPTNGRFLVITDNFQLVEKIFGLLWRQKIVYVAVLVINRRDHNKSRLFTADPHDASNDCGTTPNVIHHQSCNNSLVDTLPKPLRNYHMCLAAFGIFAQPLDQLSRRNYTLRVLAEVLNVSLIALEYREYQHNDIEIIDIGERFLTYENYHTSRLSHVFQRDIIVWIVPPPNAISRLEILFISFEKEVWLLVVGVFVLFSLAWYVLNRFKIGIGRIIINAVSITLCGSTHCIPKSSTLRFLIMCYIIYSIHIQIAYVANLTRLMMSVPTGKPIGSFQQLVEANITISIDRITLHILAATWNEDMVSAKWNNINSEKVKLPKQHPPELLHEWYANRNFCMPIMLNTLHDMELILRVRTPDYFTDQDLSLPTMKVFATTSSGYFIDSVDEVIDRLTENGFYDKLDKDKKFYADTKKSEFITEEQVTALSFEQVSGVLLIYCFGLLLSLMVFIGELIVYHCKK